MGKHGGADWKGEDQPYLICKSSCDFFSFVYTNVPLRSCKIDFPRDIRALQYTQKTMSLQREVLSLGRQAEDRHYYQEHATGESYGFSMEFGLPLKGLARLGGSSMLFQYS